MRPNIIHLVLLIAISTAIFFNNLGSARLWDRDEPRNAGCAAEMLARGDWVVPMFNDELRHQKPILLYWLIMSAYQFFGESEFAARFWSAASGVGTVLATYGIAVRLGHALVGLLAGVILSSNLMFAVAARAATPDSLLIFCGTTALWIYVVGTFAARQSSVGEPELRDPGHWFPRNPVYVIGFYSLLGLGVLAKGPIGFLLPMAVVGWFGLVKRSPLDSKSTELNHNRRWRVWLSPFRPRHFLAMVWSLQPLTGAIVVLLIAAPWFALVDARTQGDFTRQFFFGEHFGRATTALESHGGNIGYYPLAILVGFFPWSIFWVPVVLALVARIRALERFSAIELFCLLWILLQVGVFSLVQTKLPSYVTPCYPALAILTSLCLVRWARHESRLTSAWIALALSTLVVGGVLVSTGLGIAAIEFFPQQRWLLLLGLIPILGGAIAGCQLWQSSRQQVLMTTMASSILFCFTLFGYGTVAINSVQQHQLILDPIAESNPGQLVAAYRGLESSWVYYSGKTIYECALTDEPDSVPTLHRDYPWQPKPRLTPESLLRLHPNTIFITTDEHLAELKNRLPQGFDVSATAGYFLKNKQMISVSRTETRIADGAVDQNLK